MTEIKARWYTLAEKEPPADTPLMVSGTIKTKQKSAPFNVIFAQYIKEGPAKGCFTISRDGDKSVIWGTTEKSTVYWTTMYDIVPYQAMFGSEAE